MIYLASPYSHADLGVRAERMQRTYEAAARLISEGQHVFSPMAHSLAIAIHTPLCDRSQDFEFWREMDEEMIRFAEKVVVLALPGWTDSKGVAAEIQYARTLGKPIEYIER